MSGAGVGVDSFWRRQLEGRPTPTPLERFETDGLRVRHAIQVGDAELAREDLPAALRRADRYSLLGALAVREAVAGAGFAAALPDPARAGVVVGTGAGGLMFHEEQMWQVIERGALRVHPHSVPRISPTAVLTQVAMAHGLRGPGHVVTSACTSGAHAVGQAFRSVQRGEADVMIAVGTEAPLTRFSFTAFSLLGVLATAKGDAPPRSRPFDRSRDGFVMGEGAAALVLEAREHAVTRDAPVLAELRGYGQALGAYHPVAARPDGEDAAAAISAAVVDAGIDPAIIDFVHAHGTGTVDNDHAEALALHQALGAHAGRVPVSSSKPMTGHTLGAAGALGAVVACLALHRGALPPTAGHEQADDGMDLDVVAGAPREQRPRAVLSNAFGFGNINVCLIFTGA